jgi:hypothetical protein
MSDLVYAYSGSNDDYDQYYSAEEAEYDEAYSFDEDFQVETEISVNFLLPFSVLIIAALLAFLVFKIGIHPLSSKVNNADPGQAKTKTLPPSAERLQPLDGKIASFFSPSVKHWEPQILAWAKEWNLDANLIATVMQIESCGNPQAVSSAGAAGLFQVMPFHFVSGENSYDPQTNAKRGLAYLRQAFEARSGDVRGTLASYNGGITGGSRPESSWADEMVRYARWGSGIYQDAIAGSDESATLQEWLNAGGSSLCTQAVSLLGTTAQ